MASFMSLSVSANCPRESDGGLCTGARVISDNGLPGTVTAVFGGGSDVMVRFDGYSTNNKWPASRLARTMGCTSDRYCVDETIISDNGLRGKIEAVSPDGQVMIRFDGYSTYNKWPTSKLSRTRGCTRDGFCMEDTVISDNGLKGSIKAISKSTGKVHVKFDGYSTYNQWPTSRLGIAFGCTSDDFCVNDIIISDNGLEGKIEAIYQSGEVSVKFNGYSTYNKWPTHRLGVTNACQERPRYGSRRNRDYDN